jgi:probable HAF family extracellular repeat protein
MHRLALPTIVLLVLTACGEPTRPPVAAAPAADAEHASRTAYTVIDLGNLGGPRNFALRVNNHGQVAGNASTAAGDPHAFYWDKEHGMRDLGTLGGSFSTVGGMNDDGMVVGCSGDASDTQRAFVWTAADGMRDIGTLGGSYACARGVSEEGEVVGYSTLTNGGKEHGFTWTARRGMRDAGQLNGTNTELGAVSPSGRYGAGGGNLFSHGHGHAVLWNARTGYTDLGTLGHDPSGARGVNDRGQVVGISLTAALGAHGFYWDASSGMIDIVPLDGPDGYTDAVGINEHGMVVGSTSTPDDNRGYVWTKRGGMRRIDGLPGEVFGQANGINDEGAIVGTSEPGDGTIHAILWMPKDE